MDTQILEDIGLTGAEIKVYLALLKLGPSNAGPVLDRARLHNSVVHNALNRLIEKGLVSYTKQGKMHIYQASNPKHLFEYLDEKKERLERILPELLAREESSKGKPEVTVYRGVRGMREILHELLDAGGNWHYTIGSPIESTMMGDAFWIDYHKKRHNKGIRAKIIFNESLREWTEKITAGGHYPAAEIRFLKEGFEPLTETIVRNDKVGILVWTEKPAGILLHNKELAESYDKYFQYMWGIAGKEKERGDKAPHLHLHRKKVQESLLRGRYMIGKHGYIKAIKRAE